VNKDQEEEEDEPLPVANIASRQCGAVFWYVTNRGKLT